jgi:membrane-associated protein
VHNLLDPSYLIHHFGYFGVFLLVFLESGVVIGFFLPGDSLLFTAGLLASQHYLSIVPLIVIAVIAAILGDSIGYLTGRKAGPTLFSRPKSAIFSPKRVSEAHDFFVKQGPQSLILARFIPAVRCFTPIVAGVGKMDYKQFVRFNVIGGLLWGILLPILGFTLGSTVPNIDKFLLPIVLLIAVVSVLPVAIGILKSKRRTHTTNE